MKTKLLPKFILSLGVIGDAAIHKELVIISSTIQIIFFICKFSV